ncbi:MAG: alpha/beta hydrolase [Spirochaetales bacterium]|nr:alpha/beta hydrolase [Spirochaetales bacterium]
MNKILLCLAVSLVSGCMGTRKTIEPADQADQSVEQHISTENTEKEVPEMDNTDFTGSWQGTLNARGMSMALVFNLNKTETGYAATIDSPDQGAFGLAVSSVTADDSGIELISEAVAGKFTGLLNSEGILEGTWYQSGGEFPVSLERKEIAVMQRRPQDITGPCPYIAEDIQFPGGSAGVTLAGTLTLPETDGSYPAVILISGSGPQNRDEEIMNHRPFHVIADWLTKNGIAVLRYDDRGIAGSGGDFATATSEDFKNDASAAVDYLKGRTDLPVGSIGIIGHSEGAMIAPVLAAENSKVGFIVMLAGSAFSGEEILYQQTKALLMARGLNEAVADLNVKLAQQIYQIIKDNPDNDQAEMLLRQYYKSLGAADAEIDKELPRVLTPWFRAFLVFSPRPCLEKLKIPVFALNGSKDLQVVPEVNLQQIEKALKKAGNTRYKIKEYDGLNHLFQPAQTGAPEEYAKIDITISEEVLKGITDWIKSLFKQ